MKRILPVFLALCLLLCACGKPSFETEPTTESTTEAPTTEATTEATTEPVVLYRHPLTGEPLDAPLTKRPVGVIINNIVDAQPLHGIGEADVLFEITAEGGGSVTRLLAVFTDIGSVEKIGSIRSARTYFDSMARSLNAPLIHCGGSSYALNELSSNGQPHIDARFYDGNYFYRDRDRQAAGYAMEHTLFASGEKLVEVMEKNNIDLTVPADTQYGFQFAEEATPPTGGKTANTISYRFSNGGKRTTMEYDAASGSYHGTQRWYERTDGRFGDANTDTFVDYANVFIIQTGFSSDGYRVFAELSGSGEGYYASMGKIVPIRWSRSDDNNAPFTFQYTDGTPVLQNVGKTYIGVLDKSLEITVE